MERTIFDRKDAKRVKLPALMQCCIDLKPHRYENEVYINKKIDVTELAKFIEKKKSEGYHYTYFYAFMFAAAKMLYLRPKLNQFISNRHLYMHNDISLAFVAKEKLNDTSKELMLTIIFKEDDTLDDVAKRIKESIDSIRVKKDVQKEDVNSAIDILAKLPNFIRVPIFGLIKIFGKLGLLPENLTKNNIYFSSMIISNLGSIGCGAIYHNLAEFGTSSSLATFGEIKNEVVIDEKGKQIIKKVCEVGVTLDERIADGFYFAKSVQMIETILEHPELLEKSLSTPVESEK